MAAPATEAAAPCRAGGNAHELRAAGGRHRRLSDRAPFSTNALPDHWYAVFKTVHVVFAVAWIGGGLLLTILGLPPSVRRIRRAVVTVARQAAFAGEKIFAPAGLVVFLMGTR